MYHIWHNSFHNKRDLLYQVLVDGLLWKMDDFGNYRAFMVVNFIEFDIQLNSPAAYGVLIDEERPGVH